MSTLRIALAGLTAAQGARAWGALGHATVAYVAQDFIDDATASWAQDVLGDTSTSYLASIASWADSYRATDEGAWSSPLHFLDAEDSPPTSCTVDYERDCGAEGCSVSAVANYTQRVGDGRLSADHRAEAMRFLVHLLGDLTQPLHNEALKRGGNEIDVTFQGYKDNLHSDWDTYIPQLVADNAAAAAKGDAEVEADDKLADARAWADELSASIKSGDFKDDAASWIKGDDVDDAVGSATRWATDANGYVCSVVMPDGEDALTKGDLFPDYSNATAPTVELQIAKGGYRLANWLNTIHAGSAGSAARAVMPRAAAAATAAAEGPESRRRAAEMDGREFLPKARELSRAKMIRAAEGYGCNCGHRH